MFILIHHLATWYLRSRMREIRMFMDHPGETQTECLNRLIWQAAHTAFGKAHGFRSGMGIAEFQRNVPIFSYEKLYPWIERTFTGESDILWPGQVNWFAKSSGTTNDRSKYIPLTEDSLEQCHYQVGRDMLTLYLEHRENSRLFTGRALSIGGSHEVHPLGPHARSGDLSAVLIENLPTFYRFYRTPSKEVALMSEWEAKIEAMARETMEEDITSFAGVPTWTVVLFNSILERRRAQGLPADSMLDVWPNLEVFFHGGVAFGPYRRQFEAFIPSNQMRYMECYNASEGFFGLGNPTPGLSNGQPVDDDMLLMLDYGIFYEFIPLDQLERDHPIVKTIEEVDLNTPYALVISTNGGLWRYLIGDTVMFTSRNPYRFKITGRTKHYINVFGEELMVDNADRAIAAACQATGALVNNYTAAPIYFEPTGGGMQQGGHEWFIEFDNQPTDFTRFCEVLDATLKTVNSDYEAKRHKDMALRPPVVHNLPAGTFYEWMRSRGKLGGQNKVPRLSNNRQYVEDLQNVLRRA